MQNNQPHAAHPAAPTPGPSGRCATAGWSSKLDIETVKRIVGIREKVDVDALDYIGMQDERRTVGKVIYLFNIMDPLHWRYRSTVSFLEVV